MSQDLMTYIKTKRDGGVKDDQIRSNLIASGWPAEQVEAGLKADLLGDVPPPPPPMHQSTVAPAPTGQPIAVMNVATTRGIEYTIMFVGLWISATAVGFLLHSSVDGLTGKQGTFDGVAPFAGAALLVALPIFSFLFLRLKKAELTEPAMRNDPSRKKAIQTTLLITFLIGIGKIIGYVFSLLNGGGEGYGLFGGGSSTDVAVSPIFDLLHTAITLGIAGGIFAYYWRDIHKKDL